MAAVDPRGCILDVGIGIGCNMPFYAADSEIVGADVSERMSARAAGWYSTLSAFAEYPGH